MSNLRVLIVDDETLARDVVRGHLASHGDVEIVGEAENGRDAIGKIAELSPDLIFLDIQMPVLNGFEMLDQLDDRPAVVFLTAYDEYAIKAFEVNAVDYLLKPCAKERLDEALTRVRKTLGTGQENINNLLRDVASNTDYLDRILIKTGPQIHILDPGEIIWLEAEGDYVTVHTARDSHLVTKTLASFEARLDPNRFVRVHRSALINLDHVAAMSALDDGRYEVQLSGDHVVKTSRSGAKQLRGMTL